MPWRRQWQPTPVFLPGEFHGQRSLVAYSPWGPKESDMTEQLTHCVTAPITHWHRNWDTSWPVKKWAWFSPAIGGLYLLPQVTLCEPYVLSTISKTLFGLNRGQSDFCRPVGEMLLITATWLWKMPHVRLQIILCRALQRLLKVCVGKRTLRPNA